MSDMGNLTYLAGLAVSAGLVVWGLMQVFKGPQPGETELGRISRQIQGFVLLILGAAVLSLATQMSMGSVSVADLIRSVRP